MENGSPMIQLPQLLEALTARLEAALAECAKDPARREATERLLGQIRKQAQAMRAVVDAASGEGLTPEQAATIAKMPAPQVSLFPAWADDRKESK